jgi:hypothetical protein
MYCLRYQLNFIFIHLELFTALAKVEYELIFLLLPSIIFAGVVFTLVCGKIYVVK